MRLEAFALGALQMSLLLLLLLFFLMATMCYLFTLSSFTLYLKAVCCILIACLKLKIQLGKLWGWLWVVCMLTGEQPAITLKNFKWSKCWYSRLSLIRVPPDWPVFLVLSEPHFKRTVLIHIHVHVSHVVIMLSLHTCLGWNGAVCFLVQFLQASCTQKYQW